MSESENRSSISSGDGADGQTGPEGFGVRACELVPADAGPSDAAAGEPGPGARLSPTLPETTAVWPIHAFHRALAASLPALAPRSDEPYSASALPELIDRAHHAAIAHATGGLSPASLAQAYADWWLHLAMAPGKQMQLVQKAWRKALRLQLHSAQCMTMGLEESPCIKPLEQDSRFRDPAWATPPYSFIYQSFLLVQQWWHNATTGVPGVSAEHERMLDFATRQFLDVYSPSNFIATNPVVTKKTIRESGQNLVRGLQYLLEDLERRSGGQPPVGSDRFKPGRDVAVSPGKVVLRNELMELIQYAPQTGTVRPEPVLIVPAWIMKYYILDLDAQHSLVKYLTEQGFTVFMISWKNPGSEDRNVTMDDYRRFGIMSALAVIDRIYGRETQVHATGYCLGGTLLSIAAAAMAREGDPRLKSVSLLATQTDFTEPGEMQLFINESQVRFLEDQMWEQGYLDATQMSGAFRLLRSRDLIYSKLVSEYLLGDRAKMNALMAWNADGTRLPFAMHSEYLRRLFLNNDLANGRYPVEGRPVVLSDLRAPVFAVGTSRDHVAPWRSVFKINLLTDTDVTFCLASGGHNAGIVSEPGHKGRWYKIATRLKDDPHLDPDTWEARVPSRDGSWWVAWSHWLAEHSGEQVEPPRMGPPQVGPQLLEDAPGRYVHMT